MDLFFARAQAFRENYMPREPISAGTCARCGADIYEPDIDFGLSDGVLCEDCLRLVRSGKFVRRN